MVELTEDQLGTLVLSMENGYCVANYNLGFPAVRDVTVPHGGADGEEDLTALIGPRVVSMTVGLNTRIASGARLADRLLAYLQPHRRPVMRIQEPGDDRVRRLTLRGNAGGLAVARPKFHTINAAWRCPSGLIEGDELRTATVTPTQAESGRVYDTASPGGREYPRVYGSGTTTGAMLTNDGTRDAPWTIRLFGPLTNPVLHLGGRLISLTDNGGLDLDAGQIVTIESIGKRLTFSDGSPALQYVDFAASDWWAIAPGTSQFSLSASAFGTAGKAVITYRDTW